MRSEAEMLELILNYARGNEDVRAVIMNGSRVNPTPKKTLPGLRYRLPGEGCGTLPGKLEIVRYFGEILILQTPEDMDDPPPSNDGSYGYLMQFMDGNRIDLGFNSLDQAQRCVEDTLSVVLLDKDNRFGQLPPRTIVAIFPKADCQSVRGLLQRVLVGHPLCG